MRCTTFLLPLITLASITLMPSLAAGDDRPSLPPYCHYGSDNPNKCMQYCELDDFTNQADCELEMGYEWFLALLDCPGGTLSWYAPTCSLYGVASPVWSNSYSIDCCPNLQPTQPANICE
jgi:hypothetical protein